MTEPAIHHKDGCPEGATKTRRGDKGDLMLRCIACGRFAVIPEPEVGTSQRTVVNDVAAQVGTTSHLNTETGEVSDDYPAPEPLPELPLHLSRYRCRVHHHEAVTWRGTGCRACSQGAA